MQYISKVRWFLPIALVFCQTAFGQAVPGTLPLEERPTVSHKSEQDLSNDYYGFAPIVAYTPTYGFMAGVAAFVFPKIGNRGLDSHLILLTLPDSGRLSGLFTYQNEISKNWAVNFEANSTNFFTSYYGEGDQTSAHDKQYNQRFFKVHEGMIYYFDDQNYSEFFVETRSRTDLGLDGFPNEHLTASESRTAGGFNFTHDTRDSLVNTRKGVFAQAQVFLSPAGGTSPSFAQLEVEGRKFYALPNRFILGVRAEGAYTAGRPTYNYEYNLGGLDRLRGYLFNRFRGNDYYLGGGEMRKDLWKDYVQLAAFTDIGDIRDQQFHGPRAAYGAGLRIGLPPDWDMKFRIDFAKSNDQSGLFATFGQAF